MSERNINNILILISALFPAVFFYLLNEQRNRFQNKSLSSPNNISRCKTKKYKKQKIIATIIGIIIMIGTGLIVNYFTHWFGWNK
jgi:hypothetical protein